MADDVLSMDDLPAEARRLIDESEKEIIVIRDRADRQIDEIRLRADHAVAGIQSRTDEEVQQRQRALLALLRPMQEAQLKQGKLDEALAIRERIRGLKAGLLQARQAPENLINEPDPRPGRQQIFEVTGNGDGMVWGSDVYTGDSSLSAAVVHAGVLGEGERGVVRVTFVDALNVAFTGTFRNGVDSADFGAFPVAYRVERA
jgi:hypothetical protein